MQNGLEDMGGYRLRMANYFLLNRSQMKYRIAAMSSISIIFRASDKAVTHTDKAPSLIRLAAIAATIKNFQIIFAPF